MTDKKYICKLFNSIMKGWTSEHRFHPVRKWRFDYANEKEKIAIEIEGGAWVKGRHTRGAGYIKDMEKYNTAQLMGWRVFRYTPQQIAIAIENIKAIRCNAG